MIKTLHKIGQKRRKCPHFLSFFPFLAKKSHKNQGKSHGKKGKTLKKQVNLPPPQTNSSLPRCPFLGFPYFFMSSQLLYHQKRRELKNMETYVFSLTSNLDTQVSSYWHGTENSSSYPPLLSWNPTPPPSPFSEFQVFTSWKPTSRIQNPPNDEEKPSRFSRNSPPLDESMTQGGRKPHPWTTPKKIVLMCF